ncbi:MAG: PTS ascorbate transporter subunit IIC [Bacillota bacterium]|nr:PTS ascorbate transporter subunit IIC [Bacillota bacterium]
MSSLSNVFDWDFFWGTFGFLLKTVSPFVMLVVAIAAVGLLLAAVISAVRGKRA